MTAPARELAANFAGSVLDGAVNASTTSIDVVDGSLFPVTGNFRIIIDSEIILVIARSSNTLTVVRAQEGTTGASHSSGADVTHVITSGGIEKLQFDSHRLWGYSRPLNKLVADDGSTIIALSDFAWVNQDSALATDQAGTILMEVVPEATVELRLLVRNAPSTPYSYIAAFQCCMIADPADGEVPNFGLVFYESGTGKGTYLAYLNQGQVTEGLGSHTLHISNVTSPASSMVSSLIRTDNAFAGLPSTIVWMKMEDNGTNLKYYIGTDSESWVELASVGRTSYMAGGPDMIGWYGAYNNASANNMRCLARLLHWSRE